MLDGQRVFRAHIDIAYPRPDGISGDQHAFQNEVRVALQDAPVHEGPGVPLVGIAHNIFGGSLRPAGEPPFWPVGSRLLPVRASRIFPLPGPPGRG